MITFAPHTANPYRAATQNSDDYASLSLTVAGNLQPASADSILREFGVDLGTASVWFMNLNDAYNPKVGDRLLVDGAYWEIQAEPLRYTAIFFLAYQKMPVKLVGDYA